MQPIYFTSTNYYTSLNHYTYTHKYIYTYINVPIFIYIQVYLYIYFDLLYLTRYSLNIVFVILSGKCWSVQFRCIKLFTSRDSIKSKNNNNNNNKNKWCFVIFNVILISTSIVVVTAEMTLSFYFRLVIHRQ